eukprot:TRINITY_DN5527_c0_g3_i4.p2 TRINITY_DN5527_c0_g3~~TRINITY_DN5527_c0_g3_i4.p2  ORF type:complete len:243 (-),score=14.13 TRINITY_DN5527_c0_g3_i4:145-873(-)
MQGFSNEWWKRKHNTHHALTNQLNQENQAVDPDIDTLPYLAWSEEQISKHKMSLLDKFLVKYQQYLLFPILCLARLAWLQQSIAFLVHHIVEKPSLVLELAFLCVYYVWWAGFSFYCLSPVKWIVYMVASQMISGFFLSIVFIQSHNGMEVFSERKDFPTAQVLTTRNIESTLWNDWFSGGLNYQIEHHLFPMLPRHNFGKVRQRVIQMCQSNDLFYESCSFGEGTSRVLKRLAEVASSCSE